MSLSKLGALLKGQKIETTVDNATTRHYLDTGYPPLNEILTGDPTKGFPSGQIVMIAGPSGCGKTAILCEMGISAQKQGGYFGVIDMETQFSEELARERGMSTGDNFGRWIPDTFEDAISTAIKTAKLIRQNNLIDNNAPIVFGFDSIHSMTPQSKYDNMMDKAIAKGEKTSMHDQYALSRATSEWFPVIQREFNKYGVTGIFLNQVRKKTDAMGREFFVYPGGDSPYFYSSTVLVLGASKVYDDGKGDDRKLIRNEVRCVTEKSRNTVPQQKVRWDYTLDKEEGAQFDVIGSFAKHLQKIDAIETSGPRVGWKGGTKFLSQVIAELKALPKEEAFAELLKVQNHLKEKGTPLYPYPKKD